MTGREMLTVWPLALIVVFLGIFPFVYLNIIGPHMNELVKLVGMPWTAP
jgi:NADH:ubiquinone oxidoreductase subunit 4 (subunit M)